MGLAFLQVFLASPYRRIVSFGYDLPNGLVGAWLTCGSGFQSEYDLDRDEDADRLVYWWLSKGRSIFPGIRDVLDRHLVSELHFSCMPLRAQEQPELTPLLSLILRHRKDLNSEIDRR